MNIAVDARPLLEPRPGGVRFASRGIVRALTSAGAQVTLWLNSSGGARDADVTGLGDVHVVEGRVPNKVLNAGLCVFARPHLDRIVGNSDWFVMPNPNFAAFSPRARVAVVFHDLSFEVNPSWFSRRQRLWHRMVNPRRLALRADRIIAVSENTKRDLIDLYRIPEEKIVVVPPVWSSFNTVRAGSADLGDPNQKPFLLFLGEVSRRKNVLGLIRAFETLAPRFGDLGLVIAGPDGWGAREVDRAISGSPARTRIRRTGTVSEEEKMDLLRRAAVFVYPSFYEGFGLPVVEAMASGVPVVASHSGSLPEVAGDAAILIDPYDLATIHEAIRAILSDSSFASEISRRGRVRADEFASQSTPDRLLSVLEL